MQFPSVVLLSCILLCSVFISNGGKCSSLVNSPFDICTNAGYNYTLPFPEKLVGPIKTDIARFLRTVITTWQNCSKYNVAATMECSFMFPKCSAGGERVYPCRRVCGEFLKQCGGLNALDDYRAISMDFFLALCLSLPNETSSDKCFEPPNFTTNDSIPNPLDRGCQDLIIPACKNIGIYNHTHFSKSVQKTVYKLFYQKTYNESDLEKGFPKKDEEDIAKFPKCRRNIVKMFCGELLPPCFPGDSKPTFKTLCRSVCDDIARDCPEFFSGHISDSEFCGMMAEGNTSHGYCDQNEWPPPLYWLDYLDRPTLPPSEAPDKKGPKGWVIAVVVVLTLAVAGLVLGGLIWWKWRSRVTGMRYTKQEDEAAPEQ